MGTDGELLLPHVSSRGLSLETRKTMFIRNIETVDNDVETTLWKRYAILPCLEGQKYSIGRKFTSREEQGEFIHLPYGSLAHLSKNETAICEINVEQGKYWVTPTSRTGVILINGVKVVKRTELKFGNNLSLGVKTFLFKERELDPAAFIYTATKNQRMTNKKAEKKLSRLSKTIQKLTAKLKGDFVFAPGQNGLIVSQILSYLPVDDVKSCRFVSKLWNEEAFKILRKRCTLNIGSDSVNVEKDPNHSMKLLRYLADMKTNSISNWNIHLPKPGTKLVQDLTWFLSGDNLNIHRVKRVNLWGSLDSKSDNELCHRILQTLAKHLEELTLNGYFRLDNDSTKDYELPEYTLPKLRVFTLSRYYSKGFQHIIKLIKGVKAIRLDCSTTISLQFLKHLHDSNSLKWFSNLNEIKLHQTTPELINILLKFPNRLKKLELNELKDMKKRDFHTFGELLSKHARHLESLKFVIPQSPMDGEENLPPVFISFPAFPKLEVLNIGWNPGLYLYYAEHLIQNVKLTFPNGTSFINYETDMPSLKSLSIAVEDYPKTFPTSLDEVGKDCACFFELFFPPMAQGHGQEIQICQTVQHLDISYGISHKKGENGALFSKAAGIGIQSIFPNVRNNAWLNSIRDEEVEKRSTKKSRKSNNGNQSSRK